MEDTPYGLSESNIGIACDEALNAINFHEVAGAMAETASEKLFDTLNSALMSWLETDTRVNFASLVNDRALEIVRHILSGNKDFCDYFAERNLHCGSGEELRRKLMEVSGDEVAKARVKELEHSVQCLKSQLESHRRTAW